MSTIFITIVEFLSREIDILKHLSTSHFITPTQNREQKECPAFLHVFQRENISKLQEMIFKEEDVTVTKIYSEPLFFHLLYQLKHQFSDNDQDIHSMDYYHLCIS